MHYTKEKHFKSVENLYLRLVVIVSISALVADYCVIKQFINILNEI